MANVEREPGRGGALVQCYSVKIRAELKHLLTYIEQ